MKKLILYFLILFCFQSTGFASNVLKQISNTDGLSNNSVNCIYEDSDNVIWIGTWDGLNSFDGSEIRTYRYNRNNPHSISNNVIRQIVEEDKRYLWIATDYGVNRWDRYEERFIPYFHSGEGRNPKQENSYLIGTSNEKILFSYIRGEGWCYFDAETNNFTALDISLDGDVKSFLIDNENNLYILLQNGELYNSIIQISATKPTISTPQKIRSIDSKIQKIYFSENKIILQAETEIIVLNKLQNIVKRIGRNPNKMLTSLLLHNNNLYASYYEGGCVIYNLGTNIKTEISEISNRLPIFTLYMGSQDILWTGTDGQGVMMMYTYNPLFTSVKSDYAVRSFCATNKNELLVGTKGGGIKLLNKTNNTLKPYLDITNGLQSNSVYAMTQNGVGDIFIGTEGEGLSVLYGDENKVKALTIPTGSVSFKAVYSIHLSNNDSVMWLGTSGYGLIRIDLAKESGSYKVRDIHQFVSTQAQTIDNDIIYAISNGTHQNELWFGTRGAGLYKIDTRTNKIDKIDDSLLTSTDILCLQRTDVALWVGTSYGLSKLWKKEGQLKTLEYTDNQGLVNNTIHGVLEDESNNIWISTNLGLSFLDTKSNIIENYTFSDGLQSNEFSDGAFFVDKNKQLYFGGVEGLSYFKPENIRRRSFMPDLKLSRLKIYNTPQNVSQRLENNKLNLSYDEQYLSFTFVTNDFINNHNCEYAYRLSEDQEWIHNGNNSTIIFSKLNPGDYTLEVKYTNGDKVWNDNTYTLPIYVATPWWLSNIAIIVYIILIGIIVYIIQSVVKNRFRLNRQILLEKVEKQHQEKVHETRLDFFTNVAHEFFTPLTLIYGPAQHLLDASNLDSYNKRYIQIIKNNAERMQKLINELMDFRKAKSGHKAIYAESIDIQTLVNYISDNYAEIAEQNGIDYRVDIENDFVISSDRDFLEKILLNLISNAFKYTPNNGYIHLNIWQNKDDKSLEIRIRNSGRGLTTSQMEGIFNKYEFYDSPHLKNSISTGIGLNLTQSLIELLGGTINVESSYGEYVEFAATIPPLHSNLLEESKAEISQTLDHTTLDITAEKDITILIVDDEKNIRELLKDILSPYYQILEADDGQQALDIIKYNHPDIIISDVMMPNMDGMSLISRLKSNLNTVHIPIISISAKISIEDSIEAYKHGADLYIVKPFHPRHVLSTVANLITKQKQLKGYYNSGLSSVTIQNGIEMHREDQKMIQDVATYIHNNITDETLNPSAIAEFLNVSKATLYRNFKEILDSTPSEFIRTIRLEYASKLLITTKLNTTEIIFKSGFNNKSYFYREFAKVYEMSPVEYRNKQQGS